MRKLNELEGVVIGIIHHQQSCTAYEVRMQLKASPSSHWRASAGAIYPLLTRLEDEGFLKSTEDASDGRGRKLMAVTPAGKRALKAWIKNASSPEIISEMFDPVRSRIFFLAALTEAEQLKFAQDVLDALEHHLTGADEYLSERPASEGLFEHLGAIGGVLAAKSRVELLKKVLDQVDEDAGQKRR